MVAAINACAKYKKEVKVVFPTETMIGALANYISTENDKFQPMNANFGIVPELKNKIRDKREKCKILADRGLTALKNKIN